jgi:protein phosphatase
MGGYNAGEIASGIATTTVVDTIKKAWKDLKKGQVDKDTGYSLESLLLKESVEAAHQTIFQVAQSQPQCAGMGTTVVAVLLHDDRMSVAHVGDSRLYRYRLGFLEQITRDHSLLEELIARGHYSREDATKLVRKNIVTRALGVEPNVNVDLLEDPLEVGDILLLCSDGLTDMVSEDQIGLCLRKHADDLASAAKALIQMALDGGGKDNVSVVLAKVQRSFARGRRWYERLLEWI